MAPGFRSLVDGAKRFTSFGGNSAEDSGANSLFPATTAEIDGDACTHDCDSCAVSYPRNFKVETSDTLYGHVKGWSTHVLVATGKSDWTRDVEDEKGSVMQAFGKLGSSQRPSNGRLMLSACNIPTPSHTADYSEPTRLLLLPAFVVLENVTPDAVPTLVKEIVDKAPTTGSPLAPWDLPGPVTLPLSPYLPATTAPQSTKTLDTPPTAQEILARPSPHAVLVLLCSQKTRDARCGQSAPLIRKELERHLRPLGLSRDLDDERPGGVGIYFISHVGGHKYSANVLVYRRPDAFGIDGVERANVGDEEVKPVSQNLASSTAQKEGNGESVEGGVSNGDEKKEGVLDGVGQEGDVGAAQCIWLARVTPQDCENLVRYTILQGKVVKPGTQLRGGFDRGKGLMSW